MAEDYIGIYHPWQNYGWNRELDIWCSLIPNNHIYLRQATSGTTDYTNDIHPIKDQLWKTIEKFIHNLIEGIVTYQTFNTYYPNEVIRNLFFLDRKPRES